MPRRVRISSPTDPAVAEIGRIIASGGLAVIPTETLYGIATNPLDPGAVEKVYKVKRRSSEKPLLLLASTPRAAFSVSKPSPVARLLARRFWPGPLTLVLPASPRLPPSLRGGGDTVGVRVPGNPVTLAILAAAGGLATGTSANLSGRGSPRRLDEVDPEVLESVDIVVDSGELPGVPSTLVEESASGIRVIREGAVASSELASLLGLPSP